MALNPPMVSATMPCSVLGEAFLLHREGIAGEFRTEGMPPLTSKSGVVYLTTLRIVYVATPAVKLKDGEVFSSFDLPLKLLREEKFHQPIFGANNLTGVVDPITTMGLSSPVQFKLSFTHGNSATFLYFFLRAVSEIRHPPALHHSAASLASLARDGRLVTAQAAFIDPSDPSVVYVTQPETVPVAESVEYYPGAAPPLGQGIPIAESVEVTHSAAPSATGQQNNNNINTAGGGSTAL